MTPPTDNPAVMPLEEVETRLKELLTWYSKHQKYPREAILSALHHLEAGKRDKQRLKSFTDLASITADGSIVVKLEGGERALEIYPDGEMVAIRKEGDVRIYRETDFNIICAPSAPAAQPQPKGEA